jgi:hypothetical protein
MRTDISDGIDLMATARESLLRDVLPALPADRRYVALMIANAMAIAVREADAGVPATNGEATELQRLLASVDAAPDDAALATAERLRTLRRAIKDAIRAGRFDAPAHAEALSAGLLETTRAWVAISNPKALRRVAGPPAPHRGS